MSDELGQVTYWVTTTNDGQVIIHSPPGQVSDGYHTFDELYAHRCRLFVALLLCADTFTGYESAPFKTRCDDKGNTIPGWFIGGMDTPHGQITYHLPDEWWDKLPIRAEPMNFGYDGHTSADALERLGKVINDWS